MNWTLLQDPGVWSTAIAFLALVLSQLPPIRELLRGLSLKINVADQVVLTHNLGLPHMIMFIDLRNTGGQAASVIELDCVIRDNEGKSWRLPAQTYQIPQPNNGPAELLIGSVVLKPSENWKGTIRCYRQWTETEEEEISAIRSEIQSSITSKLPRVSPEEQRLVPSELVEADKQCVDRGISFWSRNFDLHKGNYVLYFAALADNHKVVAVERFAFTLYESQIQSLKSIADDYKYGAGIYYLGNTNKDVIVRLRKTESTKRKLLAEYRSLRP